MNVFRHDIVIVGGGGAGLRAAIAAAETDPNASIALVSKVYPMRSHTVSAEGGAAAVARDDDNLELHGFDTVKGSDFLGDQDCHRLLRARRRRRSWRCSRTGAAPCAATRTARVATRAFGGMTTKRTWYAADKIGFHMLHALFQHSMRFKNIVRYDEYFVSKLLVDGGACRGVAALDIRTGEYCAILGRGVILTTGGAGKIFPFTTNGTIKTGDGMALAYRAGVAAEGHGVRPVPPDGPPRHRHPDHRSDARRGRLPQEQRRASASSSTYDYGVGKKAELGPRDMISRAIVQEIEAGRGFEGPYGDYVHLDLTHLGADDHQHEAALRARAREDLRRRRSRDDADPDPPGRALHDGRRRHRHPRRDRRCPASTPRARPPASRSTAPTGSARTR